MKNWINTGWLWLGLLAFTSHCTHVEDQRPADKFEQGSGPLPLLRFETDSIEVQEIAFDTIANGGIFSIEISPFAHHTIEVVNSGKTIQLSPISAHWKKDSANYTICKNQKCRTGQIVLINRTFTDTTDTPDTGTNCIVLHKGPFYVPFFGSIDVKELFPMAGGVLDSFRVDFHIAENQDDTLLTYLGAGGSTSEGWAWDTLRYFGRAGNQCYKGKIALILGDTSEPTARDDHFYIPTGSAEWPETDLVANDKGAAGTLGNYLTRTAMNFSYLNRVMNTANGNLEDTLIDGQRFYRYTRTQAGATGDRFTYYFKNQTSGRITKATVWIDF